MHVLVLGAGVIGTTTAYYLKRDGAEVTAIDHREAPGLEASYANGGIVHPSMADPWAAPGMPSMMLKWFGRDDAPFLLRLHALPGLMSWGVRFLRNCTAERWRRSAELLFELAVYSSEALHQLSDETGLDYDRGDTGTLKIFHDELSMNAALRNTELLAAYGLEWRDLDRSGCLDLEPALEPVAGQIAGGVHYPADRAGDAHKFTLGIAGLAREMGVAFEFGRRVERMVARGDEVVGIVAGSEMFRADAYVLALGSGSAAVAGTAGLRLPIYPVKGYSLTLGKAGMNTAPVVPVVDDGRKIAVTPLGDRLRIAGTAEFTGFDTEPTPARLRQLAQALRGLYPELPLPDETGPWAGLRPLTADDRPIMGATRYRNLFLNTGHGHLGWTLACGSGRLVADLVSGRPPALALDGFAAERFR